MTRHFGILCIGSVLPPIGTASAQTPATSPPGWVQGTGADLEIRASPFDSTCVLLGNHQVEGCYSCPRKLGRPVMSRLVPFGAPSPGWSSRPDGTR